MARRAIILGTLLTLLITTLLAGVASARKPELRLTTQQQHAANTAAQNAGWNANAELSFRDTGRVPVHRSPAHRVQIKAPVVAKRVIKPPAHRPVMRLRTGIRTGVRAASNLLASLGEQFHSGAEMVARAKASSKARQSLLDRNGLPDRNGLLGRIRAAGFDDDQGDSPLTRASYVRMGAVDELFRKIDAMIMGGRLTHNDLRIEHVRVTRDGTLALVGWTRAQPGGEPDADLVGQQRLRTQIERLLYH